MAADVAVVPPECWLRVATATGQVLFQGRLPPAATASSVKEQIEKSEGFPVDEQVLSVAGEPISSMELLRNFAATGGEGIHGLPVIEVMVRRVAPDWARLLEDLSRGIASFEQARSRLRDETAAALQLLRERAAHLGGLVQDMSTTFQAALKKVNESGSSLLASAGDLQRNRDTVFEVVPRSSKGCRQAAEELMNCRNAVLAAVQANGQVLVSMKFELGPAHKVVLTALRESSVAAAQAREAWRREGELMRLAKARGWLYTDTAKELERNYMACLKALNRDGRTLEVTAEVLASCRQGYRRAIVVNRNAIRQAEASLQRDQEVIFGWAVDHVSEGRKGDRKFIMTVIEANGEALERAPEEFRRDREVVLLAVRQSDGWALQFAAEELKCDREVVMAAVRRNGWALEHAAEELRKDREIVLAAVQANGEALDFAADALKRDREVVLTAVRRSGGWALQAAARELRADPEIAAAAVRQNSLILEHVGEALRADRALVLEAVQANGLALEHAALELRQDREIVWAAIRSNPTALRFAGTALQGDREVVLAAVKKDGFTLQFASTELKRDRALVTDACMEGGPGVLEFAGMELRSDPAFTGGIVAATKRPPTATDAGPAASVGLPPPMGSPRPPASASAPMTPTGPTGPVGDSTEAIASPGCSSPAHGGAAGGALAASMATAPAQPPGSWNEYREGQEYVHL